MKQLLFLLSVFGFLNVSFAQNTLLQLSGELKDKETNEALIGAQVRIKESGDRAITDIEGKFVLKTGLKLPFTLQVTASGFVSEEFRIENEHSNLNFQLSPQVIAVDEVVISASRVSESILKSPVAIDKLDLIAIRETPAPSFYDALENVKGVQLTTSSLNFKVPNTRGFNSPNNFRFMQLMDGVDVQAPTLGVSIGNTVGPTELDIRSVEIIPGSSSALYGINSVNGLVNLQTKNPYTTKGVSVYQRTGMNHVDGVDHAPGFLSETAFRVVNTIDSAGRFAFKINASYFQGIDWVSSSANDQNTYDLKSGNPSYSEFSSPEINPAYDAWNKYGDERNNNVSVQVTDSTGSKKNFNVRRTGYWEKDLIDPAISTKKADFGLYYKFKNGGQISYTYRVGQIDGVFQRGNKVQLNNMVLQNHAVEYKSKNLTVKSYVNLENTGDSYNLKPLADNLDLTFKSNSQWKTDYQAALQTAIASGSDWVSAHESARAVADAGRPEPGSDSFNRLKDTIVGINNWDHKSFNPSAPATGGAALKQTSHMYHSEAQYDLSSVFNNLVNLLIGADARVYEVIPDGNNFVDLSRPIAERSLPGGNNQYYTKTGGFVQASKEILDSKLKFVGSLRYDKNFDFKGRWNPRIAVVYMPTPKQSIRISAQNGFRFPSLFEALSYVNNGGVRRVGGLEKVNEGLGYLDNSYTLASVDAFTAAINADIEGGMSKNDAVINNKNLLVAADLPTLQPEQVKAFDLGYKSILFDNKLVIDFDAYTNVFSGFLGQVEVAVPTTGAIGTDSSAFDMTDKAKQVRYRVYTNAKQRYLSYGSALRLSYNFYKLYSLSTNVSFNDFIQPGGNDVFVTAFNTPRWSANVQFGNREIVKNLGFNIVWKWQDAYDYQSPLANGRIGAFQTIDAQISYKLEKFHTSAKLGGTNIFNKRYIQYAAGPTIGALYYLSLTYDLPLGRFTE
jgi:outer membrane receptor protein involved in Fe transport